MQNHRSDPPETLEDCPSHSELAALLDGTLEPARAEEVRQHVLDCASCFAVYADAHHFEVDAEDKNKNEEKGETEVESGEGKKVLPFEPVRARELEAEPTQAPRPRRFRWGGVAAAAGLVLAALTSYRIWPALTTARPSSFTKEDIAGLTQSPAAALKILKDDDVLRDAESDTRASLQARLDIGARTVDLEIATASLDRPITRRSLVWISRSSEALKTPEAKESRDALAKIIKELEDRHNDPRLDPQEARTVLEVAEALRTDRQGHGRDYQDFGHWTELGRLAAGTGDRTFFETAKFRRFLDWLQSNRGKGRLPVELTERGLVQLDFLAKNWPEPSDPKPDFPRLQQAFVKLQKDAYDAAVAPSP